MIAAIDGVRISPGLGSLISFTAIAALAWGLAAGWVASWIAHRYQEGEDGFAELGAAGCRSCGHELTLADVAPIRSWGRAMRCPSCREPLGRGWIAIQVGVPLLCLAMVATWGSTLILVPFLWLVPVLVTASAIDIRTLLIPRRIVYVGLAVGAPLIVAVSVLDGVTAQLRPALIGAVAYFGLLFVMSMINPAGMGFGDVRLSLLLGLYLGWIHVMLPAVGLFIACLFGIVLGLGVRIATHEKGRAFPFGPGLALGTMVAICFYQPILERLIVR